MQDQERRSAREIARERADIEGLVTYNV